MSIADGRAVPRMRVGYTVGFQVGDEAGTLTVTGFPDGRVGEVVLRAGTHGSTLGGMTDAFSTAMPVALQRGAPLGVLAGEMRATSFGSARLTEGADGSSIMDFVTAYLTKLDDAG